MPLLGWIILFTAFGGIASAAFAGLFLLVPEQTSTRLLPHFVSFATGALLGAALLALLPEAMEGVGPGGAHGIGVALVVGLGIFFVIEKLVLWRHAHSHGQNHGNGNGAGTHEHSAACAHDARADVKHEHARNDHAGNAQYRGAHEHAGHEHAGHEHAGHEHAGHEHGPDEHKGHGGQRSGYAGDDHHGHDHRHEASGVLVLVGDSIHNALDGILIAAAFLTNVPLGLMTTFAVAAHEVPHRVGDFALLVHAGMSRARALVLNLATGLASVIGGIVAYFGLQKALGALPYALAFAAAGFVYIAVAGLIPALHRRADPKTSLAQVILIGLGVAVIAWAESLTGQ